MKKIRFLILALVGLLGGVVSASGKTVYIKPNEWAKDNAIISLNVWVNGTGGNIWTTLTEVEEQISAARRAYNGAVMDYNNACEMFPTNLVANFFRFEKREFFAADESEKVAPNVSDMFKR